MTLINKSDFNELDKILDANHQQITIELHEDTKALSELLNIKFENEFRILVGTESHPWSNRCAGRMAQHIIRQVKSSIRGARLTGVLANVVVLVNRSKQRGLLPVPPIYSARKRPPNPWGDDFTNQLAQGHRLRTRYNSILEEMASGKDNVIPDPLMLFIGSAILYGGLLHEELLAAMMRLIVDIDANCLYFGKQPQFEFRLPLKGEPEMERRYWYLDPLSSILLMRFRNQIAAQMQLHFSELQNSGNLSTEEISRRICSKVLAQLWPYPPRKSRKKRKLSSLLKMVSSLYLEALPPFLVAYMRRELISNSVRRDTLERIYGEERGHPDEADSEEKEADLEVSDRESLKRNLKQIEPDWLPVFRQIMHLRGKGLIAAEMQNLGKRCKGDTERMSSAIDVVESKTGALMADFAVYLLKGHSTLGRRLATSTIQRMTCSVASRVWGSLDNTTPVRHSARQLFEDYVRILEGLQGRTELRRSVGRALLEFHAFLVVRCKVESIDARDLNLGAAMPCPANANLITEAEYQKMQTEISTRLTGTLTIDIVTAAQLALMLGYRCGLRHGEIVGLRPTDLLVEPHTNLVGEIMVRPWVAHELKSKNSTRRIPVELLLNDDERRSLADWRKERLSGRGGKGNQQLFDWKKSAGKAPPRESIFVLVFDVMRSVTKDRSINFHHCRHSAATNLFLRFHLAVESLDHESFAARLLGEWPDATKKIEVYKGFCGSISPTRKALYALGQILGHSSGDVTAESYLHCLDFLQFTQIGSSSMMPPPAILKAACEMAKDLASVTLQRSEVKKLLQVKNPHMSNGLQELVRRLCPAKSEAPTAALHPSAAGGLDRRPLWIDKLQRFLERTAAPGLGLLVEEVATENGYDGATAERMIGKANDLEKVKTRLKKPCFELIPKSTEEKGMLRYPRRPHQHGRLIRTLATRFQPLMTAEAAKTRAAIDLWIHAVPRKGAMLTFQSHCNPDQARAYRDFLRALGQPFRWVSCESPSETRWKDTWRIAAAMDKAEQIVFRDAPQGAGLEASKWIAIEPRFPELQVLPAPGNSAGLLKDSFREFTGYVSAVCSETSSLVANVGSVQVPAAPAGTGPESLEDAVGRGGLTGAAVFRYVMLMASIALA